MFEGQATARGNGLQERGRSTGDAALAQEDNWGDVVKGQSPHAALVNQAGTAGAIIQQH